MLHAEIYSRPELGELGSPDLRLHINHLNPTSCLECFHLRNSKSTYFSKLLRACGVRNFSEGRFIHNAVFCLPLPFTTGVSVQLNKLENFSIYYNVELKPRPLRQ